MEGVKTVAEVHPIDVISHPSALSLVSPRVSFWIGCFLGIAISVAILVAAGSNTNNLKKSVNASQWLEYWNRSDMQLIFSEQSAIGLMEQSDNNNSAIDRNLEKLEPRFRAQLVLLLNQLKKDNYAFALLEGYRSPERQAALFAKGAGKLTLAGPFQSKHQFGLAADIVAIKNGVPSFDVDDPNILQAYRQMGLLAEQLGLVWGGRWVIGDYGHIESAATVPSKKLTMKQIEWQN